MKTKYIRIKVQFNLGVRAAFKNKYLKVNEVKPKI